MSITSEHEPTLGEVARTLARLEVEMCRRFDEVTRRFDHVVTIGVYEAQRQADLARVAEVVQDLDSLRAALDKERDERRADRRMIVGSGLSLLVAVAAAALLAALGLA